MTDERTDERAGERAGERADERADERAGSRIPSAHLAGFGGFGSIMDPNPPVITIDRSTA